MIYILEDDAGIRNLILYSLKKEGLDAAGFEKPSELYAALKTQKPKLFLLDITLPEEDGIQVLKRIKKEYGLNIPCVMITAKGEEYDKVLGLNEGADDYIAKPFGMMELLARIKAILRRYENTEQEKELRCGRLILYPRQHLLTLDDKEIVLTRKEFDLLKVLMSHPGICFSRDDLLDKVWGYEYYGETRTVDVHIRTLRQKLQEEGERIETLRGVGYRFRNQHE